MKTKTWMRLLRGTVIPLVAGAALSIGSAVYAQGTVVTTGTPSEKKSALYNAFEAGLGVGYNQGVGDVGTGQPSLTNTGGPGVSGELDLGWRINPSWLLGTYGTVAWLSTGNAAGNAMNNWTASAGIQGNYHFLPGEEFDPWIGLGAGWRGYFVNRPEGRDVRHGLDVARLQIGVDIPVATGVAIAPFVGATASLFLTQQLAQDTSFSNISNPNVNLFFNAGVMGRFDLFGRAR
jgi:hypothetical protein